eukprot:COSAG05_NODE_12229_length_476_cov_3.013263_1_plen_27_part_01
MRARDGMLASTLGFLPNNRIWMRLRDR